MTKYRRGLAWMLPACVLMGVLPGVVELMFGNIGLHHFLASALQGFVYSAFIAIPCYAALPGVLCRLHSKPAQARIAVSLGFLALFCLLGCFAANSLFLVLGLIGPGQFTAIWWWSLRVCLIITFSVGTVSIIIGTLQGRLQSAKEALHFRELAEERQKKIAAEARFASLESRIHPHFLFNTLNSISALVREDPREAERMIERLSALLRFSLDSEVAGLVPLGEELRIVRDYLEIEKVRFGVRLRYRIEAVEKASGHMIPALSIQTLVENSVKYAVGARSEGAEIVVRANLVDGLLRVEVSDDGPGFPATSSLKPGHGLDLLERRLTSLFGGSASLEMSAANGRTLVAISVST